MSTIEALRAIKDKYRELYSEEQLLKECLKQEINNDQLKWLEAAFELVVETPYYTGQSIELCCEKLPYPPGEVYNIGEKSFWFNLTIPEVCLFKISGNSNERKYVDGCLTLTPLMDKTEFIFRKNSKADPCKIALWMHKRGIKNSSSVEYAVFKGQIGSALDELYSKD